MEQALDTPSAQVLVVDDEPDHAEVMAEALKRLGHVCTLTHSAAQAAEELQHGQFDLIVTDLVMESEHDGLDVLAQARRTQPNAEVIMVTAHGDIPTTKLAIRGGAFDFIEKPIDLDLLRNRCTNAIETVFQRTQNTQLRDRLDERPGFEGIIGQSAPIRGLIRQIQQIGQSKIPVLITGESGTGKELVARAIHQHSPRHHKPFVPLNTAGLTESILEDELFGHVKGAYTGADREREGRFEYANGGTLFLDEIGDMPRTMQAKLLRVLESGEVVRLGANDPRHVDVRLVSATNRNLPELVKEGDFREDLYFRVRGVELKLPPLRERREDIPLLVQHYVAEFARQTEAPAPRVAEDVQRALMGYDWPGNVRQLMSVLQSMIVIAAGDPESRLEMRHLPDEIRGAAGGADGLLAPEGMPSTGNTAGLSLDQLEKQAIRDTLHLTHGNREKAAEILGIGERTLYRKLKEYGLK